MLFRSGDDRADAGDESEAETIAEEETTQPRRSARISARGASLAHEQEDEMAQKEFKDKIYRVIEQINQKEDYCKKYGKAYKISEWLVKSAKGRRDGKYKKVQSARLVEPRSFREAMDLPQQREWAGAILEELNSMEELGVWELEAPPPGTKAIAAKWTFKLKRTKGGEVARFKARLCARGDQQRQIGRAHV